MGIKSPVAYIDFFINLNMGNDVNLLSFINNEKRVLKQRLEYRNIEKESIQKGIDILEGLTSEIKEIGETKVLEKYRMKIQEK